MPPAKSSEEIQTAISKILSSEEFRFAHDEASTVTRSIGELFQSLIFMVQSWIDQIRDVHPLAFAGLMVLSSTALLFAAWWGIRRTSSLRLHSNAQAGVAEVRAEFESSSDLRARASMRAEVQDYVDAVRLLFKAFIREHQQENEFRELALSSYDCKTYLEQIDRIQRSAELDLEVYEVLKGLERGLYGHQSLGQVEYERAYRVLAVSKGMGQ